MDFECTYNNYTTDLVYFMPTTTVLVNTKSVTKHTHNVQEIKLKKNQQQHPRPTFACFFTVLGVTVRGGFPPLL